MHFCILLLIITNSFVGGVLNKVKYIILGGKNGNFRKYIKKKRRNIVFI